METEIVHLIGPMTSKLEDDSYWSKLLSIFKKEGSYSYANEKGPKDFVLFVDGGWRHFQILQNRFPNLNVTSSQDAHWVGDGDSLERSEPPSPLKESDWAWTEISKTKLSRHKSKSDLLAALHWLDNHHDLDPVNKVVGHGLLGGRLDHQLAVLGDFSQWLSELSEKTKEEAPPPTIQLLDDEGRDSVTIFFGKLATHHIGTFSVFSVKSTAVNLRGDAEYIGDCIELRPHSSKGLSNIGKGNFSIQNVAASPKETAQAPLILIKNFD